MDTNSWVIILDVTVCTRAITWLKLYNLKANILTVRIQCYNVTYELSIGESIFPFELLWFLLGFEWNSPHQFEHHSYLPHKKACLGLPVMPCYAWAALLLLSLWADSGGAIPEETSDDVELDNVRQCKECGGVSVHLGMARAEMRWDLVLLAW